MSNKPLINNYTFRSLDVAYIKDAFDMHSGFVLDFTDCTFSEFIDGEVSVDIDEQQYHTNGSSKAKRLLTLLKKEDCTIAIRVLESLWEYREKSSFEPANKNRKVQTNLFELIKKIKAHSLKNPIKLSAENSNDYTLKELTSQIGVTMSNKPYCFMIQPFNEKFDKLYKDIYKPAIETTECEPYRVDEDDSVANIAERIRKKIRGARICLADITEDNPNVWYEVGFAHAQGKQIVLIAETKDKIPFDMSGEKVIFYDTSSPSDFEDLKENISNAMQSRLKISNKTVELQQSYLENTEGLSPEAIKVIECLMEAYPRPLTSDDLKKRYYQDFSGTSYSIFFGIAGSKNADFIEQDIRESDYHGDEFAEVLYGLTKSGVAWALKNKHAFSQTMHTPQLNSQSSFDDDMPF
jgi:nucleoside 2-deoxyribosyltransferase